MNVHHARVRLLALATLFATLLVPTIVPPTAYAATIVVNTTADQWGEGPACALREAIQAANTDTTFGGCRAGSGADTITLSAGTYTLTRGGEAEDVNATGDVDLSGNLLINGADQVTTIIDGNSFDRVIEVLHDAQVTITNVTLRNGEAAYNPDPGPNSSDAGGVFNLGTLTLVNSTVTDNTTSFDTAGIENRGTLTLTGSTVQNNIIKVEGVGGIRNNGTLSLANSVVQSNLAPYSGVGGIWNFGQLTITDSVIAENGARGTSAIANDGSLIMTDSSVRNNSGDFDVIGNGGTTTIRNSSISGNRSSRSPGGISSMGTLTLDSSQVVDNQGGTYFSDENGDGGLFTGTGGVANSGTATITNTTISGNRFTPSLGDGGGGILNIKGDFGIGALSITNSTISGNSASGGSSNTLAGGIMNMDGGTITLASTTVNGNTIMNENDGDSPDSRTNVYNQNGSVTLRNTIIANTASPIDDCGGTLTSQGYNLIQQPQGCTIAGTTTSNKLNVAPKLGPLADNGGPTLTHALLVGSPAIDAGNPVAVGSTTTACPTTDQRGVARPQDGNADGHTRCDIGAYEVVATTQRYRVFAPHVAR